MLVQDGGWCLGGRCWGAASTRPAVQRNRIARSEPLTGQPGRSAATCSLAGPSLLPAPSVRKARGRVCRAPLAAGAPSSAGGRAGRVPARAERMAGRQALGVPQVDRQGAAAPPHTVCARASVLACHESLAGNRATAAGALEGCTQRLGGVPHPRPPAGTGSELLHQTCGRNGSAASGRAQKSTGWMLSTPSGSTFWGMATCWRYWARAAPRPRCSRTCASCSQASTGCGPWSRRTRNFP